MSLCWKKLGKLLTSFSLQRQYISRNKQFIWALFCIFSKIHPLKTLIDSFHWLITLFICFFGKFVNTISLKDFVESLFHFKLDLIKFNKKLLLVKSFLNNFAKKVKSDGSLLDITSRETYSKVLLYN